MAPANKGKKYPPEPLTRDEIARLLAACSRRGACGVRMRALIVVLWRGGLRISEALALRLKDVDFDAGTVAVLHGKGDRRRVVGMDPQALAVVEGWMRKRQAIGIGYASPIFCTITRPQRGGPLGDAYVREALKQLGRKAGIEKRVHPHGLRHTHAFELAIESAPILVIKEQLGHADLNTTYRYINHLHPQQVVEHMRTRRWHLDEPSELERAGATGEPADASRRLWPPANGAALRTGDLLPA